MLMVLHLFCCCVDVPGKVVWEWGLGPPVVSVGGLREGLLVGEKSRVCVCVLS